MDDLIRKLVTGSAWALAGRLVTAFCALAANAILARLLVPEALGAYFLTFSVVSVAVAIAQLGLNQTLVRLIGESVGTDRPGRGAKVVRLCLRFGALGILFVGAALGFGAGAWLARDVFGSTLMAGIMALVPIWIAVIAFPGLLAEAFRGYHDIRLATLFGGAITSVLSALLFLGLWLIQGHSSLGDVVVLAIAAGVANTLIAGMFMWRRITSVEGGHGVGGDISARKLAVIATPLWLTSLVLFALTQADLWVLGIYRTPDEVAVYGAAARLVVAVATPLIVANAVLPPVIAEMYAQGRKQELQQALRATATMAGIPTIAVLIVFMVFGAPILGLVFGDFYREGATVLVLLSLSQLVNVATGSCGITLVYTGHQMVLLRVSVVCGLVTILGSVWAAPRYGMEGVAVATLLGMTLQNILMLVAAHRKAAIWTHVDPRCLTTIPDALRALRPLK